jgi:hypothetical protein
MEAIAAELGLLSEKTASVEKTATLEQTVLTQVQKKEEEDRRDEAHDAKVEGGTGKTDESQAVDGSAEAKTVEEKKEAVNDMAAAVAGTKDGVNTDTGSMDASAGNNQGATVKEAADGGEGFPPFIPKAEEKKEEEAKKEEDKEETEKKEDTKEEKKDNTEDKKEEDEEKKEEKEEEVVAEPTDEQKVAMVLAAYDKAFEKLASQGYNVADYVYSKVQDEKIACEIAENAEKLAFVTEQNPLKVADDIIETITSMLQNQ